MQLLTSEAFSTAHWNDTFTKRLWKILMQAACYSAPDQKRAVLAPITGSPLAKHSHNHCSYASHETLVQQHQRIQMLTGTYAVTSAAYFSLLGRSILHSMYC